MKTQTIFIILGIIAVGVIIAAVATKTPENSINEFTPTPAMETTEENQQISEEEIPETTVITTTEIEVVPVVPVAPEAPVAPEFPVTGYEKTN